VPKFRSSALSRLAPLVVCALGVFAAPAARSYAQPRALGAGAAEPALPAAAAVRLSTREPDVEWGTVERRPEPIASNATGPVLGGAGSAADYPNAKVAVKGL